MRYVGLLLSQNSQQDAVLIVTPCCAVESGAIAIASKPYNIKSFSKKFCQTQGYGWPVGAINLKKSFHPRKTQKARKISKRYQALSRHPKSE